MSRQASALAVVYLSLSLVTKVAYATGFDRVSQVPFVAALFVLPMLYALPVPRRLFARYRWPVLVMQAVLTWVPFAIYGGRWVAGICGLLAGLMLLIVPGRKSWLAAALVLAADLTARAAVTGLPWAPECPGAVWAVVTFADDGLMFFGMIRLAQVAGEVDEARRRAACLAVARERLQAAETLQAAVGQRLVGIAAKSAAARRALPHDAVGARAQIAAAGITAREAAAQARALFAGRRSTHAQETTAAPTGRAVTGAQLAWAVLALMLSACTAQSIDNVFLDHDSPRLGTLLTVGYVLTAALQLRHSRPARQEVRPRGWPVTLALQALLACAFFLPSLAAFPNLASFLAGSVLLLAPGRWRWAGYAAVIVSWAALFVTAPPHDFTVAGRSVFITFYGGAATALTGLLVYGLAGLARELKEPQRELARVTATHERLRLARDVHDLLGLGLSVVALKADLITALIGRDDARAAAEMVEMGRVCAAARADMRRVTIESPRLSLSAELATAKQVLNSAGIKVRASMPPVPLLAVDDGVLAPVVREAVTNILRHAAATACTMKLTVGDSVVRLHVRNDGITDKPATRQSAVGACWGRGLANLTARVQAAGGQLTTQQEGGRFALTVQMPLSGTRPGRARAR